MRFSLRNLLTLNDYVARMELKQESSYCKYLSASWSPPSTNEHAEWFVGIGSSLVEALPGDTPQAVCARSECGVTGTGEKRDIIPHQHSLVSSSPPEVAIISRCAKHVGCEAPPVVLPKPQCLHLQMMAVIPFDAAHNDCIGILNFIVDVHVG